jgi:hypothetical protein
MGKGPYFCQLRARLEFRDLGAAAGRGQNMKMKHLNVGSLFGLFSSVFCSSATMVWLLWRHSVSTCLVTAFILAIFFLLAGRAQCVEEVTDIYSYEKGRVSARAHR